MQRLLKRRGKLQPLPFTQERAKHKSAPVRADAKLGGAPVTRYQLDLRPVGVECPVMRFAGSAYLGDNELAAGNRHPLIGARGAVVEPEGIIDCQHVEAEKTEYRPRSHQQKGYSGDEPDHAYNGH